MRQLKTEAEFASAGVEKEGISYLTKLSLDNTRVTLIDKRGKVLYDNFVNPENMSNHLNREEVKEAMKNGEGDSIRYSGTIMKDMLYHAHRLSDGSILRVAESRDTVFNIVMGMLIPMIWILVGLVILSYIVASKVAKKIVDPLNKIDLENPLENNEDYEEITPFLHRIYAQQKKIEEQNKLLKHTEDDLSVIADNMAEGLIILNEKGIVKNINEKAKNLIGTEYDCSGMDIMELERRTDFQKILEKGTEGKQGKTILTYGGIHYQIDISPILENDKLTGMVVLFVNITN